ncbi:MAG: yycG [Clostridia bacterium]|nr:yycG [Clostridia bacterium]
MRSSIKRTIVLLSIAIILIVYVSIFYLTKLGIILTDDFFHINNLIILLAIFVIVMTISSVISKMIIFPLRKIERNMKSVVDGKSIETKHLKGYNKFKEIDDLIDIYSTMMEVIKKNNFDLNSQKSKTEIILEQMADGVIAFSVTKDVIHINKSAINLLGISKEFDNFDKIISKINLQLDFDQIMYLPNYKSIEYRAVINENILNLIFVPFFSDKLIPMGIIMVARNVTESVRLDNMRKEFVANVSHELKTPLTSIKGYSETMMRADLTDAEISEFAKVINQEASRMDRLVVDLLQLSKFDYSKASFKKTTFSLSDLATNVTEKMKYSASQKEHTLDCEVIVPTKAYADKDSIEQVIMNVVSNSIKYTPDGGNIMVYVGSVNNSAYIKIVDNGMGIPEKDLQRIFERFYRVDKARSRQMGGTGLGLAIVKEIVDGNGGTIDIRSEVDKGTEIIITLPVK